LDVLVDAAPELRLQCVACEVRHVNAILLTHHHADHVVGLDDVRRFNWLQQGELPVYGLPKTLERIRQMFWYAFIDDPDYPSSKPSLKLIPIDGDIELSGHRITVVPLTHGRMPVLGFRFNNFAYCTDVNFIPDESLSLLRGLEVLVLDGLRRRPHPTHFNLAQAVEWAGRIGARQTYFTHIAHELKHAETNAELPDNMQLGYDGQTIDL
jgi:phosphoribosyl 1,2-cyclic phosphate phosphodiesterase